MKSYKKLIIGVVVVLFSFVLIYFGKSFFNSKKNIAETDKNSNNIELSSNENSNSKNKVKYIEKRK